MSAPPAAAACGYAIGMRMRLALACFALWFAFPAEALRSADLPPAPQDRRMFDEAVEAVPDENDPLAAPVVDGFADPNLIAYDRARCRAYLESLSGPTLFGI